MFVWGLNDKDQLAGLTGSKIKLPMMSHKLSTLKPVHIAGGSKSLFVVSMDGKVSKPIYGNVLPETSFCEW